VVGDDDHYDGMAISIQSAALGRLTGKPGDVPAGVGIIGSLASILACILVPQPAPPEPESGTATPAPTGAPGNGSVEQELAKLTAEIEALRLSLVAGPSGSD
jgi:hypothetical protein